MSKYDDTTQPPPIAPSSAVGNAFMASALLTIVALIVLIITEQWTQPIAWKAVVGVFAAPLAVAGLGRLRIMMRQAAWELETYTRRDIDGDGVVGRPEVRLIPVQGGRLVDGVDERDLAKFIEVVCSTGRFTQRDWRGADMPSGRVVDNDYYALLIAPLVKAQVIVDRNERVAGRLVTRDAEQVKRVLGLINA
jgi:hypothetical protein